MQVLKKGFTLILGLAMILTSTAFVFAEEGPLTGAVVSGAEAGKVTLKVDVGEHGKVNGKTGTWEQQVTMKTSTQSGEIVQLHVVADEGYVLEQIYVNGEIDNDSDSDLGKSDVTISLPELYDNMALKFTFKAKNSSTEPGTTDSGTSAPSTPSTPGTSDSGTPGTEPSTGGEFTFSWTVNDASLGSLIQSLDASLLGAASGSAKYTAADVEELRTINILAGENAVIDKVTINGTEDPKFAGKTAETYVLTTGNVDMKVFFKSTGGGSSTPGETFKIDTKAGPGGTISDPISYVGGTEQVITWTSDFGYVIESVKIDGADVTENVGIGEVQGSTSFTTGNHSVEVTFKVGTDTKTEEGDAGKLEFISNSTYKPGEDVEVTIIFTPASQEFDTDFVLESSDWEIVSVEKGTLNGKTVNGTIPKGTAQDTNKVVLRTTNTKSRLTVTFTQNGKTTSGYVEAVGYDGGEEAGEVDLTDGILGFTVDGEFYAYTNPEGQNDEYFQSMTMISARPDSVIKVAIQKDDEVYEAGDMEVSGIDGKQDSFTGQELYDSGMKITTEGLEIYRCFTVGATFDSKYTVPTELQPSAMSALITLDDEDIDEGGADEDGDLDDGVVDEDDSKGAAAVKTGDETNMPLYASAMFMSMLLLGTLLFRRRVMNN